MEPLRHMNLIWVAVPLLIPVILAGALFAYEESHPPVWVQALEKYLALQEREADRRLLVQQSTKAARPWNFFREMSRLAFWDSMHSITDAGNNTINTGGQCYPFDVLDLAMPIPQEASGGSSILPYPPEELWCVLLKDRDDQDPAAQVVFIARHSNLYESDWIVHESVGELPNPALPGDLSRLGGDLELK